jgi:hypothetical protein
MVILRPGSGTMRPSHVGSRWAPAAENIAARTGIPAVATRFSTGDLRMKTANIAEGVGFEPTV